MNLTVMELTNQVIGSGVPKGKRVWRISTEQGEVVGYKSTRAEARREAGLDDKSNGTDDSV